MNLNDITIEHLPQIEAIVRRLATEMPEHEADCIYVDDTAAPSAAVCIVGCALFELGVTLGELAAWDDDAIYELPLGFQAVDNDGHMVPALRWLEHVQSRQDAGYQWGDALAYADNKQAAS
jgi:cytochrome P450